MLRTIARKSLTVAAALAMAGAPMAANACTSFLLKAQDGAMVYGRTLEFALPLQSQLAVFPRNLTIKGTGPDGSAGTGLEWKGKYAAMGANGLGLPILVDGLNEKGLAGGMLFFPGLARFQDVGPGEAKNSIASFELLTWMLTNFATVDEVKAALPTIKVSNAPQAVFKSAVPLHVTLHDLGGKSIVVEYVDGTLNIYDNPTGIMTNAPAFPWQIAHAGLYGNLSANEPPPRKVGDLTIAAPSSGAGLHGLPGDFLSPSRFVRAFTFVQNLPPLPTGSDAMKAARHILNNFDIPPGAIVTSADSAAGGGVSGFETTEWTAVADLKNGIYAIWDYENPTPRLIDFKQLDLDAKAVRLIPFNQQPSYIGLSK
ncbi:choloylglycine hydrolase [Angulomicrobium tetraedrale]|uniref:Choloylglycine hydrolase n=1 Tax=Ancylobacter tetraedralis TaxID=217068 RepID=A0A839ZAV5_9HYPH|nr:choloylglycine hydrolase family protein [Ancylobacter tetraedralis]MBB3771903.1 choloylglycine hydrolase [Ancylobacter tetraedralis]